MDPNLTPEEQVKWEIPFSLVVTAQLWHERFIERFEPEAHAAGGKAARAAIASQNHACVGGVHG
jgi:hypothetical protein